MSDDDPAKAAEPLLSVELRALLAEPGKPPESRMNERLRTARTQLALSVEGLSRLTKEYDLGGNGVSSASITRYEAGDSLPGARELRVLCDSLEVPPVWLLYGKLENAGASSIDQELLRALDAFVRARKDDVNLGGATLLGLGEWYAKEERAQRLARARKPGAT